MQLVENRIRWRAASAVAIQKSPKVVVTEAAPRTEAHIRSTQIQQNAWLQQVDTDAPGAGRFVIVPPTLAEEQRREYVRYEEDDEGNLL